MELCKNCHGGCCRRYNVPLLGVDVIKICDSLQVDMPFFTSIIQIEPERAKEIKNKTALFRFPDISGDNYFTPTLKVAESKYAPGTVKCLFLQEWIAEALGSDELSGIIGRCGIYSCRPISCRAFPAIYKPKTKQVIIKDPHLILEKKHKNPDEDNYIYNLCSRELTEEDYRNFTEDYVKGAFSYDLENKFFIELAAKWNKDPDVSDEFYNFLKEEYTGRVQLIKEE